MLQPQADIFLNRLRENYQYIQSKVGTAKVMAVVKADAYGHGIVEISNLLVDEGIHGFCVALVSEVQELIQANNQNPILHLGQISFLELDVYETGQVRCTINSINDLKKLEEHGIFQQIFIQIALFLLFVLKKCNFYMFSKLIGLSGTFSAGILVILIFLILIKYPIPKQIYLIWLQIDYFFRKK